MKIHAVTGRRSIDPHYLGEQLEWRNGYHADAFSADKSLIHIV
jgi:hypothetical protein